MSTTNANGVEFLTIRKAAEKGPFGESALRRMQKQGLVPGLYIGRTYYVNYDRYVDFLKNSPDIITVQ